jgi:hypothetical protein
LTKPRVIERLGYCLLLSLCLTQCKNADEDLWKDLPPHQLECGPNGTIEQALMAGSPGFFCQVNGVRQGPSIVWHRTGEKQYEGAYKNGAYDGIWRRFYKNGQMDFVSLYKDGNQHGPFSAWHENGQKAMHALYREGKTIETVVKWYPDGQVQCSIEVNGDLWHGKATWWYPNGQTQWESQWNNGAVTTEACFDNTGKDAACSEALTGLSSELQAPSVPSSDS